MKKFLFTFLIVLSGCASSEGRYSLSEDETPDTIPTLEHIENPQPRYEEYSLMGNKNYRVRGKYYEVLTQPDAFSETGDASWYGKKFHGHKTANGEIYDMYSMSAAHKSLPLPSYVEVENVGNGKKIIVRVNDRGPFHEKRIIDLSYAAAAKLDMLNSGTVPVKITLLKPEKPENTDEWQTAKKQVYFIQIAAIEDEQKALEAANVFGKQLKLPAHVVKSKGVYRVRLGPFYDYEKTQNAHMLAKEHDFKEAFVLVEPFKNQKWPH